MLILQIIISFIAGGLAIALQTLFGERVPLQWRGVVLTIPSTLALGLLFIGLTKTPEDVPQAAVIIPAALGVSYSFVLAFTFFSRWGIGHALIGAFGVWGLVAEVLLHFPPKTITQSVLLGLPIVLFCYAIIRRIRQVTTITPVPFTLAHVVVRSAIGGSIVALVVFFAKTLGNTWGGFFSAFPGGFLATLLIYYLVHGKKVVPSVATALFFPGSIGLAFYAIVAAYTFSAFGVWMGTLFAYLVVLPFFYFFTKLQSFTHPGAHQ